MVHQRRNRTTVQRNHTHIETNYNFKEQQAAFRSRDRAMLAIFYGCGLRRNEGVHVDVPDINFDKSILHVRKGKELQGKVRADQ